jgi:hypothetical protein
VLLGNTTLVASLVALARRARHRPEAAARGAGLTLAQGAQLALAALLVGGALVLARGGATQQRSAGFTQLWALPGGDTSRDSLRLGIRNQEPERIDYRLLVTSGGAIIGAWPRISLEPGGQWQAAITLPGAADAEATLYRLDAPDTVYRRVVLRRGVLAKRN